MRTLLLILALTPLSLAQVPTAENAAVPYLTPDSGIKRPEVIRFAFPELSDEVRKNDSKGMCTVLLIVGVDGLPHNVHVLRCTDSSMEQNSIASVLQYRFKPAAKADGTPTAVHLTIYVNFGDSTYASMDDGKYTPFGGGVHVGRIETEGTSNIGANFKLTMRTPPGTTSTDADANGVYPVSNLIEVPVIKKFEDDHFGISGYMNESDSTCDVTATIDKKGKATNLELLSCSHKNLEAPALKSLEKSKYQPGKLNNKTIAVRATIHVEYLGLAQGK